MLSTVHSYSSDFQVTYYARIMLQADLLAAKSALATAEASKCALEQEVESLKEHQRQQQRQHTSEKEASSGRYQAMESEVRK